MANLGYIGLGAMGSGSKKEDCAVLFHPLAKRSGVPA
jgi:hypothetical protein